MDLLRNVDLLLTARQVRRRGIGRTPVGRPSGCRELQATIETVAGVNGPVATRLALRERIPDGAAGDCRSGCGRLLPAGDDGSTALADLLVLNHLVGFNRPVDGDDAAGRLAFALFALLPDLLLALR